MNIIDAVSICILVLFVLFGIYKGFISTLLNIGAYFVSVVLSFLLKPLGASAIKHSDRIFNMMLYYTEGSEFIANPEYVRMEISSLSTAEINDIIASSNLPFPMGREIAKNIAREAFSDQGIVTLGDYFNQTIVGVFINILMFLVCFLIIRTILSLVINGADYADPFPMLKSQDGIFGGALGLLRGMLALLRAAQAYAALRGRAFVTPDDVKRLAVPVLAHRLIPRGLYGREGESDRLMEEILQAVPVPTEARQ